MRRGLALILCVGLATPAWSAPFVSPDPFTVSGRFELAKAADGPLKGHLRIALAVASPEDAKILMANPAAFDTALTAATTASLRNFGYLAGPETADALSLQVRLDTLEVTPDKEGVTVVARFRVEAPDGTLGGCVPKTAEAKYRALAPVHGGDRQRALGIVALVAFAAIGYNASQLVTEQFQIAKADQAAANARRERIEGESVSPESGDKQMAHFAAVNATQLALADFVRQLGRSSCATAASSPEAPAVSPAAAKPAPAG